MDIRLLRTFVAAFEEENFTKAAHRLHATQPGVSAQIAALEARLGTALFERNARCVTVTGAARRLYPRALKLIRDFNDALQDVRALPGLAADRVAIGVPPSLSSTLVLPTLCRYMAAHPQSDVSVVEARNDSLLSQIERDELDVALLTHAVDRPAVAGTRVCDDPIVLAAGPHSGLHPSEPVQLDATDRRLKIVIPSMLRDALGGELKDAFRGGRFAAARVLELDGLECALDFVAQTDWVALIPASACWRMNRDSGVGFSLIAGDQLAISYFVVHASAESPSAAAQAFMDLAVSELQRNTSRWEDAAPGRARRDRAAGGIRLKDKRIDWNSAARAHGVA